MNWEDTVMPFEERKKFGVWNARNRLAEAQAEISFKAGFNEALNTVVATKEYDEGKEAGIREMVEQLGRLEPHTQWDCLVRLPYEQWQAKLKEWGIDD